METGWSEGDGVGKVKGTGKGRGDAAEAAEGPGAAAWLFAAMVMLVPTVPFPFLPNVTGRASPTVDLFPPPEALTFHLLTAIAMGLVLVGWVRRPVAFVLKIPDMLVGLLASVAVASVVWTTEAAATRSALPEVVGLVGFYALARCFTGVAAITCWIERGLVAAVGLNLVFALGQLLGPLPAVRFASWPAPLPGLLEGIYHLTSSGPVGSSAVAAEPGGLMGNRNHLAFFLAVSIPFLLVVRRRVRGAAVSWFSRWIDVELALTGLVLLGTRCRGGMLGALAGIVTFITVERLSRPQETRASGSGLLVVGIAGILLVCGFLSAGDPTKTGTSGSRFFEWQLTFDAAAQRPVLGHGLASYGNQIQRVREKYFEGFLQPGHPRHPATSEEWRRARFFRQTHNEILQLFFELGSLGLACFGAFLAWFGGSLAGSVRASRDASGNDIGGPAPGSGLATAARASLVAGVVCGLTGFPFQIHPVVMILTWALAVAASDPATGKAFERPIEAPGTRAAIVAFAALPAGLVLFLAVSAVRTWDAEGWYGRGVAAMGDPKRLPEAAGCFERALEADPRHDRSHNDLGRVLMSVKRHAEAREQFEAADRLFLSSSSRVNVACAYADEGNLEAALSEFIHAAERSPSNPENHYRIGYTLTRLGRHDEALEALHRAAQLNAHDPRILWEVAAVERERGRTEAAFQQTGVNILKLRAMLEGRDLGALQQAQSSLDYLVAYVARNVEMARKLAPDLGPEARSAAEHWAHEADGAGIQGRLGLPSERHDR